LNININYAFFLQDKRQKSYIDASATSIVATLE
jgi:hypothetical protein